MLSLASVIAVYRTGGAKMGFVDDDAFGYRVWHRTASVPIGRA